MRTRLTMSAQEIREACVAWVKAQHPDILEGTVPITFTWKEAAANGEKLEAELTIELLAPPKGPYR